MRKILLTIVTSIWVPVSMGSAQSPKILSDSLTTNSKLKYEIDSISNHVNVNLDLIKYNLLKDSIKTKLNETDSIN